MSDSTEQNTNDQAPATDEVTTEPQTAEAADATEATGTEAATAPAAAAGAKTTAGRAKKADKFVRGPVRPKGPEPLGEYAIIETGGKQYRVSVGDTITVERLAAEAGEQIELDRVLLVGGDTPQIGTPIVEGAKVSATVESHFRGEKIVVFKFKAKKRYRRKMGHRQELTKLAITGISA